MTDYKVSLFWPSIYKDEWLDELGKIFDTRWLGQGPKVDEFENEFGKKFGYEYCVSTNSGTSALELAYHLIGINKEDKVITSILSCSATSLPLIRKGADIIFTDISKVNLTMDVPDFKKKMNDSIKAIVTVNLGGIMCNPNIYSIAKEYDVPIVIDACQSLGISEKYGDYVAYSFQAIKNFTCFKPGSKVIIPRIGRNGRMTKNIEDIEIGDTVITYNEKTSEKEFKNVLNRFERNYDGNFIKLKLSNCNEIEMTEDHPVFVVGDGWKRVSEIEIGDKLIQYKYYGLVMRLNGKKQIDKSVEEIFGEDIGKEIRRKHSERMSGENHPLYGKHHTDETKVKIGKSREGKNYGKVGINHHLYGKKLSEGWKRNISKSVEKRWKEDYDGELRKRISEKIKKLWEDDIFREKMIAIKKEQWKNEEYRKKISEGRKRQWKDEEYRKGVTERSKELWKNGTYGSNEYWRKVYKGLNKDPNKSELKLQEIINSVCPDEFGYNGGFELGISLDRLIPDFVNINGKKKVIELFGDYWHSEEKTGIPIKDQIDDKTKRYKKVGYDSLFIMEKELNDEENLKSKIENFIYNPNIEIVEVLDIETFNYNGKVYNIETEDNHNYFIYGILVHNCFDGGMLICRNKEDYDRAKRLRWFGIDREKKVQNDWKCFSSNREICMDMEEAGYKFHMNDVAATVGLVGLKHSDEALQYRKEIADIYTNKLMSLPKSKICECICGGSYWLYGILTENRDELIYKLKENGIETDTIHLRNDIFSVFGGKRNDLPNMDWIESRYLYIPIHTKMTNEDAYYITDSIIDILK